MGPLPAGATLPGCPRVADQATCAPDPGSRGGRGLPEPAGDGRRPVRYAADGRRLRPSPARDTRGGGRAGGRRLLGDRPGGGHPADVDLAAGSSGDAAAQDGPPVRPVPASGRALRDGGLFGGDLLQGFRGRAWRQRVLPRGWARGEFPELTDWIWAANALSALGLTPV